MSERVGAKQIAFRVPLSLGRRLEAAAEREHNHASAVMRRLLSAALDREEAAAADTAAYTPRREVR